MKKKLSIVFLIIMFTCGLCSTALSKTWSGVVTMEVDLSAQAQGQTARLRIPYPVSTEIN